MIENWENDPLVQVMQELESRIADLENNLKDKDAEIANLKVRIVDLETRAKGNIVFRERLI